MNNECGIHVKIVFHRHLYCFVEVNEESLVPRADAGRGVDASAFVQSANPITQSECEKVQCSYFFNSNWEDDSIDNCVKCVLADHVVQSKWLWGKGKLTPQQLAANMNGLCTKKFKAGLAAAVKHKHFVLVKEILEQAGPNYAFVWQAGPSPTEQIHPLLNSPLLNSKSFDIADLTKVLNIVYDLSIDANKLNRKGFLLQWWMAIKWKAHHPFENSQLVQRFCAGILKSRYGKIKSPSFDPSILEETCHSTSQIDLEFVQTGIDDLMAAQIDWKAAQIDWKDFETMLAVLEK